MITMDFGWLWCRHRFITCNKCTTLVENIDNGEGCECGGQQEICGKSLYSSPQFCCEPKILLKIINSCPGRCGSVNWAPACEPKDCRFSSQSGHMPGLWARSPVGGAQEATTHWCFPFSSPSPLINKKCNKISLLVLIATSNHKTQWSSKKIY